MLGKIVATTELSAEVLLEKPLEKDIINYHVIFDEGNFKLVGEVKGITSDTLHVNFIGQIENNVFTFGINKRVNYNTPCRLVTKEELDIIFGNSLLQKEEKLYLGQSPLYNGYQINVNINELFSNHFAVFGNTGSGKSCAVARILQNIFYNKETPPVHSNILVFDVYGEYAQSFSRIKEINPNLNFKSYTTNLIFPETEILKIPLWLLSIDDIALLLDANNHIQLPIIERALRLVSVFAQDDQSKILPYKNDIIARALLEILYSGSTPSQIRDQIFAVLSTFNTIELNLESKIFQPGYTRTLRQCLIIDKDGKLNEMQLVTEFIASFIRDNLELKLPDGTFPYTLDHLKEAFEFALISEGILKSDKVYDYANILKVRLNSLINSDYKQYFAYENFINKESYIMSLLTMADGAKAQIINFNINYVDDRFAKVITKIYSKMFFDYVTSLKTRGSFPVHIILEEAHRYVQNDNDVNLLGYNIFDRITKEGRKYGILLGLISQRPSELSETALSQCSNFLIFKMIYPNDLNFVRNMVPNITTDIMEKLKTLPSGNAIIFGTVLKLPLLVKFDLPNPKPISSNIDIKKWY